MVKSKKNVKKGFFEVSVPLTSTKISLYGESLEQLNGKVIRLDLTRSLKGKSLELKYKVSLDKDKLVGVPVSLSLFQSYIRRMMRKGVDYVEDSFVAECQDGKALVKVFLITRNRVSRAVRNALRNEAKKSLLVHLKSRTTGEVFSEITANKIQKEMSLKLKKIYPLALSEIRHFEALKEKKVFGSDVTN